VQVTTQRLILVGAGAFARELVNWAEHAAVATGASAISGFLDVSAAALDGFDYSLEYVGTIESYQPREGDRLVMAIGDPGAKKRVAEELIARGAQFAQVIHPSAVIARTAKLGTGVVVCPHVVISADATVGNFVALNTLSSIGHDVEIGAYTTLSAHVDLTGSVQVGESCFFGSGARVVPKVSIGAEARIGAGATVLRKVPAGAVMYTTPAKKL
jgi:sugar O-acyltransferase (sialic acid O-acetyltransferase NeuD family)